MIKPTIHTNGTSAKELTEAYAEAHRAVNDAMEAVGKAGPNGRDYYTQGDGFIGMALVEHRGRIAALNRVSADMLELAMHCSEFVKE